MTELWVQAYLAPGYSVSDVGRVRSEDRTVRCKNGKLLRLKGMILNPWPNGSSSALAVSLRGSDGVIRTRKVGRLVLESFVGPCPEGLECCHRDDDQTNNSLTNLRWDTPLANAADCIRNGRCRRSSPAEKNPSSKITTSIARRVRELYATGAYTQKRLSEDVGLDQVQISSIVRGKTWPNAGGPITRPGRGAGRVGKNRRKVCFSIR
jgi:hypothetical protein